MKVVRDGWGDGVEVETSLDNVVLRPTYRTTGATRDTGIVYSISEAKELRRALKKAIEKAEGYF